MKREWYPEFRETLIKREGKSQRNVRGMLKASYIRVAKAYAHDKPIEEIADEFLSIDEVTGVMRQVYSDIYYKMGKWNVEKYVLKKNLLDDVLLYLGEQSVAWADLESLLNRDLILNSNRKVILKVLQRFREDEGFLALDERASARALLREFVDLSKGQAKRIVRTEATNEANRSMLDSTQRLFPNQSFKKEWVSAKDNRTRNTHRAANGQQAAYTGKFFVGGEFLDHPGAGKRPENNIFCRCAVIPIRNA